MKKWLINNKKKLFKIIVFIAILIGFAILCYFIFKATGISNIETLRLIVSLSGFWGPLVFLCLQVIVTICLCFAPGGSMTFITLGVLCFGATWQTFLLCFSGVIISSILMDLLGRFGGTKVIIKIVGEKDYKEALNLVQEKGTVYIPVMYLLPMFPDDAICCVAGMCKIKFWYHCLVIFLCRGIGCATIVFGISVIPQEVANFTSTNLWDYLSVITILVFWVIIIFYLARKVDKWLSKKIKK